MVQRAQLHNVLGEIVSVCVKKSARIDTFFIQGPKIIFYELCIIFFFSFYYLKTE